MVKKKEALRPAFWIEEAGKYIKEHFSEDKLFDSDNLDIEKIAEQMRNDPECPVMVMNRNDLESSYIFARIAQSDWEGVKAVCDCLMQKEFRYFSVDCVYNAFCLTHDHFYQAVLNAYPEIDKALGEL